MPDFAQRKSYLAEHGIEMEGLEALLWMGSVSLPGIRSYSLCRSPQIFIECGPADAELACQSGFWLTGFNAMPQLFDPAVAQRFFPPPIDTALFRQGNTLALPLTNQSTLEFRERPHD